MNLTRWIYDHSPIFWQNFMCTRAGAARLRQRYDTRFEERRAFYREAATWPRARIEAWQLEKLRELLRHAAEHVPFYRKRFEDAGFRADDVQSFADLARLPLLTKEQVRAAGRDLVARNYDSTRLIVSQSGGSTGLPMVCYHDAESLREIYACHWEYQRPGVNRSDPYATFQGMQLIPPRQVGPPYWRMNRAASQRLYSIFHLSERTIEAYIADLDRFRPVYMQGYANSLYLLARLAEEQNIRPVWAPKAVFSTSETLFPHYRETIQRVFRTKVWDAYSQDETCASITEYPCGYYHYDRAYGYIEFIELERHGNRVLAEIVCTGLLNKAWPLVRYRIGDVVEMEEAEQCSRCGRPGPIIYELRGRTGDVLITPSGRRFPHISLIVKNLHGVRQLQLVQNAIDEILIRFVPADDFNGAQDERLIRDSFAKAINEPIRWTLEAAPELSRTPMGKFPSIVNNIGRGLAHPGALTPGLTGERPTSP